LKPGNYTGFFPIDDNVAWEKNAATVKQLYPLRERLKQLEKSLAAPHAIAASSSNSSNSRSSTSHINTEEKS
jgi:hypothetical protein